MEMWPAEMIAGEPSEEHAVLTRLAGVAEKHDLLVARRRDGTPFDLVRQLVDDGLRIEFGRMSRRQRRD
jgi:hypothetical protein